MKHNINLIKFLFALLFLIGNVNTMKGDSTSRFSMDIRLSSALKGAQRNPKFDSTVQYTFNIQEAFYCSIKHISFGLGTGVENSIFYISDHKAYNRVYQAPIFASIKLNSSDNLLHFYQNFGFAIPVKSYLPNISTGYYLQTGMGFDTSQIKLELAYKIITVGRDKRPLLNNNLTFGICFTIK